MSHLPGRERLILAIALALALAVPAAAAHHLDQRVRRGLEPTLSDALGTDVSVGSIEASLTGAVRLERVAVGNAFYAHAIEGSVSLASLLSGSLRADEIRIEQPRLRVRVDAQGHSNVERIARNASSARARARGSAPGVEPQKRRPPRIVVSDGELMVEIGNHGALHLADVQLHPQAGGVRVVVGATELDFASRDWAVAGRFARAAGDLSLPEVSFERVLAVGGNLTVRPRRGAATELTDTILARRAGNGSEFRLTARVAGTGSGSRLTVEAPTEGVAAHTLTLTGEELPLSVLSPLFPASVDLDRSLASGHAELTLGDHRRLGIEVDAEVRGVTLDDRRIASLPVEWNGHATMRAGLRGGAADRELDLHRLELTTGDLRAELAGRLVWASGEAVPRQGELHLELPHTDCTRGLNSLPTPLRDKLAGIAARGHLSASANLVFDVRDPDATELEVAMEVADCRVISEPSHADPRTLADPFEHTFPNGETRKVGYGEADYAILRSLPGYVDGAFVASEDAKFFSHHGFDPQQIENSLAINLQRGSIVRGGSTISQQLVKNVFLDHERSLSRKLQEAVLTWRLEAHLNKRLILERYLNIIELGEGIYGLSEAARYWFAKPASQLEVGEAAFLAALTPAPRTTSERIRRAGKLDPVTRQRVRAVLRHMRSAGVIDEATYQRARDSEVVLRTPLLANR